MFPPLRMRVRVCQWRAQIWSRKRSLPPSLHRQLPVLLHHKGQSHSSSWCSWPGVLHCPHCLSSGGAHHVIAAPSSRDADQEMGISQKQWKKAIMLVWRHAAQHKYERTELGYHTYNVPPPDLVSFSYYQKLACLEWGQDKC